MDECMQLCECAAAGAGSNVLLLISWRGRLALRHPPPPFPCFLNFSLSVSGYFCVAEVRASSMLVRCCEHAVLCYGSGAATRCPTDCYSKARRAVNRVLCGTGQCAVVLQAQGMLCAARAEVRCVVSIWGEMVALVRRHFGTWWRSAEDGWRDVWRGKVLLRCCVTMHCTCCMQYVCHTRSSFDQLERNVCGSDM